MKQPRNATTDLLRTRPNLRCTSLLCAASAIVVFSPGAFAYAVTAYTNGNIIGSTTTPGVVSYTHNIGQGASSVTTFTSSPVASVSYETTNPLGQVIWNGAGIMTYRFEVEAQPFTNVPIDFSGLYSSYQGTGGALAGTSLGIWTVNSSVYTDSLFVSHFYGDCGAPTCLQFTTKNASHTSTQSDVSHVEGLFEGTLDMLTGADGKVIGSVELSAGANSPYPIGSAAAFIDPHLEIDAAWLAANPGARLTIEQGVGNDISSVSAVPEPSTYALLLAGLAATAVSTRRRRDHR